MLVYRITLKKFAQALHASGYAARWNSKDVRMIYTASSRALACLENIVHRNAIGHNTQFRTMIIHIPDDMLMSTIESTQLQANWHRFEHYPDTQRLGDAWIAGGETAVQRVPSAIIPEEHNYLVNPAHPDFARIDLTGSEPFVFDPRLKP